MGRTDFLKNNRGIDDGQDLPEDYMSELYERITQDEIKMKVCCQACMHRSLQPADFEAHRMQPCSSWHTPNLGAAHLSLRPVWSPSGIGAGLHVISCMADVLELLQDPEVEGMLAAQAKSAQQGGWMDTIMNLVPGRKQAAASGPSEDAIQTMHENLRCATCLPVLLCRCDGPSDLHHACNLTAAAVA